MKKNLLFLIIFLIAFGFFGVENVKAQNEVIIEDAPFLEASDMYYEEIFIEEYNKWYKLWMVDITNHGGTLGTCHGTVYISYYINGVWMDWAKPAAFWQPDDIQLAPGETGTMSWLGSLSTARPEKQRLVITYTPAGPAGLTVTTDKATISSIQLQNNQATLKGSITNTGGENVDERGFEWGTSPGSYPNNWTETGSYGTGAFSHQITLSPGTIYYYRAKAHNSSGGWGYGTEKRVVIYLASGGLKSFTTPPAAQPDLIITDISTSGNTISYAIKNQGGATAGASYSYLYVDGSYKTNDYVVSLSAGSSRNESFSYTWTCSGTSDTIKVCADSGGAVSESNEANNCRTETFTCVTKPDLIITNISTSGSSISYNIKNQGTASAGASYSYLYVDGSYKTNDYVASLSAGSSRNESFSYTWTCSGTSDTIKVCADGEGVVSESDEGNNCRTETVTCATKPDLIIQDFWFESDQKIHYTIKNQGGASADYSYTYLYVDGSYKTNDYVDALPAGSSRNEYFSAWTCTTGQTYSIEVWADRGYMVDESNEGNNWRTETLTCPGEVPKPDLIIQDIWFGSDYKVHYRIKNIGEATAGASYSYLWQYKDGTLYHVARDGVSVLGAGSYRDEYFVDSGCSPGITYSVNVCADAEADVSELREDNNCRTKTLTCPEELPSACEGFGTKKTFYSTKDAYIRSNVPGNNYNGETSMLVRTGGTASARSLVAFNTSSLNDLAEINCVRLSLYVNSRNDSGTEPAQNIQAHKITGYWSETGVTWNTQPSFNSVATDKRAEGSAATLVVYDLTGDVNVTGESGWLLKYKIEGVSGWRWLRFYTRESSYDPKLEVFYVLPEPDKPDLIIQDIWFGSDKKVYYNIKNQGGASADYSYTYLYVDGALKTFDYVTSLSAGSSRSEYFSEDWACTAGQTYSIKVWADGNSRIDESNEGNNWRTETLTCPGVAALPDFVIEDIWNIGSEIHYKIKNQGTGGSGGDVWSALWVDGGWISNDRVNPLGPGESAFGNGFFGYVWECSGISDAMKVRADWQNSINESNENNNERQETWNCPTFTLTVLKAGTGSGTVTDTGINCGADCSESYALGTSVILTATPDAGSKFAGWSGACSGTGICTLPIDGNKSVIATFNTTIVTCALGKDCLNSGEYCCAGNKSYVCQQSSVTETFYSTPSDGQLWVDSTMSYERAHHVYDGNIDDGYDRMNLGQQGKSTGSYWRIWRGGLFFDDTSNLPDDANITGATLSLYGSADSSYQNFYIRVVSGADLDDPLVPTDYTPDLYNATESRGSSRYMSQFIIGQYNDITLNSIGLSEISKTGTTKFGLRSSRDIDYDEPYTYEFVQFYTNERGSGYQPKLSVTYTTPRVWEYVEDCSYGCCDANDNPCDPCLPPDGKCCPLLDTISPATEIKIIRTSTGEDVTTAGYWLMADNYTIKFGDEDDLGGSGLKSCEYYINSCDAGGTNCITPVTPLTSRNCNWSFQITAGKTAPTYNLEGLGRYRIYSRATDNVNNFGIDYKYLNFDFTPPETRIE